MTDNKITSNILDYWYAVEFLNQPSFESITQAKGSQQYLKNYNNASEQERDNRKQLIITKKISNDDSSIYKSITDPIKKSGMTTWGNLTFFVGKIKRQLCIEKIAKELGAELKQAEKNPDFIPLLSFQCNNKGEYINNSLSLSTILWAISQIHGKEKANISEVLSINKYSKAICDMEKKFFNADQDSKINSESENDESDNRDSGTPVFNPNSVNIGMLNNILTELVNEYKNYFKEDDFKEEIWLQYQLFKDYDAKQRNEENDYSGLKFDYFSSDLQMVKDYINKCNNTSDQGMLSDLFSYICAPYEGKEEGKQHDFINLSNDKDELFEVFSEILNAKNAPIGKWPSKFNPALMQQVAINLAISKKADGIFEDTRKIFSVNGPPGTGKTTLLKEIIANSMVEKALLLSKYEDPDSLFEEVKFDNEERNLGTQFLEKYPGWFKFKDRRINDYGVLVVSSNNNAVENITKELPLKKRLIENLEVKNGSKELQESLSSIRKMLTDEEDVYFADLANRMIEDKLKDKANKPNLSEEEKAWGLVAVPLGKKKNVKDFYFPVLNSEKLSIENQTSTDDKNEEYKNIKNAFDEQYKKVIDLQSELAHFGDAVFDAYKATKDYQKKEQDYIKLKEDNQKLISDLETKLEDAQKQQEECENKCRDLNTKIEEINGEIETTKKKLEQSKKDQEESKNKKEKAENFINHCCCIVRLIKKKEWEKNVRIVEEAEKEEQQLSATISDLEKKLEELDKELREKSKEIKAVKMKIGRTKGGIERKEKEKEELNKQISLSKKAVDEAKRKKEAAHSKRNELVEKNRNEGELQKTEVLDEQLLDAILSTDEEVATRAQLVNPWSTEAFNREREKLFCCALKLTKAFILHSDSCRRNLNILKYYWGFRHKYDNFNFSEKNKAAMAESLFNTLLLFVPVISSTFASIGSFLQDIKEPGVLGTLVVDEAGQAQPQFAVGALFRSKKAIIVGDPKQVEPVVLDDLDLLKKAYSEPDYKNYKDKTLSVQKCADLINHFGTYFGYKTKSQEWVGCPLLVHRRCISPMFDISNSISYDGVMKYQTKSPSEEKTKTFIDVRSKWINVSGPEKGDGNHYVEKQGTEVCSMVEKAFKLAKTPSLFVITPFKSIEIEIREAIINYRNNNKDSALAGFGLDELKAWMSSSIGTIHTFQGKEANEVIFVLGCEDANSYAVNTFVNSNIVNVAASRAKYRLYIIGDINVWKNNSYIRKAKTFIDALPIIELSQIEGWKDSDKKKEAIRSRIPQLPRGSSFASEVSSDEKDTECEIESEGFVSILKKYFKLDENTNFKRFGFESEDDFKNLPKNVQDNLALGIKLFNLLEQFYKEMNELDASCCGILFCKAMELYLCDNFVEGLKARFPDYIINTAKGKKRLCDASEKELMIGGIHHVLCNNIEEISSYTNKTSKWWKSFIDKLDKVREYRNSCCHSRLFKWEDLRILLYNVFIFDEHFPEKVKENIKRDPKIGGVFHESKVGKKLNDYSSIV